MVLFEDLTPAQVKLVKEICYKQLESLRRLYNNNSRSDEDITLLLAKSEISREDFLHTLEIRMEKMKKVGTSPHTMNSLEGYDLSVFKHILSSIEDKYKDKYPKAIANLWNRLFIIEDFKKFQFNMN